MSDKGFNNKNNVTTTALQTSQAASPACELAAPATSVSPAESKTLKTSDPTALGTLPIGRLLIQYSIPAIIASVAVSVYNIVEDRKSVV